ncbi:ferrous iron transport protein A [Leptotrichia sp. OH3620_COT-345]|uniref:FeoA family protein n=1 Tax=Leptotrichia sp. OH3620_COT-345 TaxID=2491048 RepID=UPI000F64F130|nr:FeoA domain-containing protein [Leptotrichia sp. OH3620_COT-345]RRD37940.1 ferrous iron transport protein A [Leptotrichia sp. OH3620_COT-345]
MHLLTAPINIPMKIIKIKVDSAQKKRLSGMGLVENGSVSIVSESSGNLIVNVKDIRIGIGKEIAQKIVVVPE